MQLLKHAPLANYFLYNLSLRESYYFLEPWLQGADTHLDFTGDNAWQTDGVLAYRCEERGPSVALHRNGARAKRGLIPQKSTKDFSRN